MKIVFTTTNKHKLKAAESILIKYGVEIEGRKVEIDEIQADDPKDVIRDKVKLSYEEVGEPVICMDSGLFINGLKGFPGVYTKYVNETIGEDGLMKLVSELEDKSAYVQRVIGFTDGTTTKIFSSRGKGEIINEKRGDNGWTYDFIFYVPEKDKTLAEMTDGEQVETWGDAWDQLGEFLYEYLHNGD